ncbi:MAG TPA: hypothetical protein VFW87_22000 [Pirellulales bacterium]|nr:hypothetical protein [Pirellulales bacterium]
MPPSLVLEVMQILEAEINLREETRVAEQSRPALHPREHDELAIELAEVQDSLRVRVDDVADRMRELPNGELEFGREIGLMTVVSQVMAEAAGILATPDTGPPAIAAETEAIELLLAAKRVNPKGGGGGGGSTPGGGGAEDPAQQPALALLGSGVNEKAHADEREVSQSSGEAGRALPEEFRAGLDEYFNQLEQRPDLR